MNFKDALKNSEGTIEIIKNFKDGLLKNKAFSMEVNKNTSELVSLGFKSENILNLKVFLWSVSSDGRDEFEELVDSLRTSFLDFYHSKNIQETKIIDEGKSSYRSIISFDGDSFFSSCTTDVMNHYDSHMFLLNFSFFFDGNPEETENPFKDFMTPKALEDYKESLNVR